MPPMDEPTGLRVEGLHRGFGRLRVLRDVSAELRAGEILLVTGANGSGKSTLLRCLAGLMAPQKGKIELRVGGRVLPIDERRRAVGFLSPELRLYDELTCYENLEFFCRLRRIDPADGGRLLERLGLPPERMAGVLSSGMRQRLRWAFALLHRPSLLLLDEPLQNLDAPGRDQVLALLDEFLEDGLAVVANPERLELPRAEKTLELRR
jgi:heme exporter protein A